MCWRIQVYNNKKEKTANLPNPRVQIEIIKRNSEILIRMKELKYQGKGFDSNEKSEI